MSLLLGAVLAVAAQAEPLPHLRLDLPQTLDALEDRYASARRHFTPEKDAARAARHTATETIKFGLHPRADHWFADPKAARAMRQACAKGDFDACTDLAHAYTDSSQTLPDEPLAYALSLITCEKGHAAACALFLSREWYFQITEQEPYFPDLAPLYDSCAEGEASHCLALGRLWSGYLSYRDLPQYLDQDKGQAFLELACDMGHDEACKFAKIKANVARPTVADFKAKCDADNGWGCHQLGRAYLFGQGVDQDQQRALDLMDHACDLGYGCDQLAQLFSRGRAVAKDLARAHAYRLRACDAGHHRSCQAAAQALYTGQGHPKDIAAAQSLARRACPQTPCPVDMPLADVIAKLSGPEAPAQFRPDQQANANALIQACAPNDAPAEAHACRTLAHALSSTARDAAEALLLRACDMDDATACLDAGLASYATVISWTALDRACELGLKTGCTRALERNTVLPAETRLNGLKHLCQSGEGSACTTLGLAVGTRAHLGLSLPDAPDARRTYLMQACDLGDLNGCTHLAHSLNPRHTKTGDRPRMMALLEDTCVAGDANACQALGYELTDPHTGAPDLDRAYSYMARACTLRTGATTCDDAQRLRLTLERRDLRAEHGAFRATLIERPQDFALPFQGPARRLRATCADMADARACLALAKIYDTYEAGAFEGRDMDMARAIYAHFCAQDKAEACYRLGASHENRGDKSRHDLSLQHYTHACDMGHGAACASAAFLYQLGDAATGGIKDEETAGQFYLRGCAYGHPRACDALSSLFDVSDATKSAFDLIACLAGDGQACTFIADDYRKGRSGVPKSRSFAERLTAYACSFGETQACRD